MKSKWSMKTNTMKQWQNQGQSHPWGKLRTELKIPHEYEPEEIKTKSPMKRNIMKQKQSQS